MWLLKLHHNERAFINREKGKDTNLRSNFMASDTLKFFYPFMQP
jgi:hypothetical protein